MKIKFKGDKQLKNIKNEYTDGEFVSFDATGKATVKKEIGNKLIENFDEFVEHKNKDKSKNDSEDSE